MAQNENNNDTTPLSREEIDDFIFATDEGKINLYKLIDISPTSSVADVVSHYRILNREYKYDLIERGMKQENYTYQEGDDLLLRVILAFKILMDPRKKAKYDSLIQSFDYCGKSSTFKLLFYASLFLVGRVCDVTYCLSDIAMNGSYKLLKDTFKQSFISSFRGVPFTWSRIPCQDMFYSVLPENMADIMESLVFYPTSYFIPMLLTVYPSYSVMSILKSLILDPETKQLSWTRFYYGFTVFAVRQFYLLGIEESLNLLRDKVKNRYLHNLNSKFWQISNRICSSFLFKSLVFSVLMSPIQVVFHQYQISAMTHKTAPNVGTFIKSIYYGQGLSKFFSPFSIIAAIGTNIVYYHNIILVDSIRDDLKSSMKDDE